MNKKLEETNQLIAVLLKERYSAVQRVVAAEKREEQVVKTNAHLTNRLEKTKGMLQDVRGNRSQKRKIPHSLSPKNKKGKSGYDTYY